MPLYMRIPKRGFHNKFADVVKAVNLSELNEVFKSGDDVTLERLKESGLASGRFDELKILGNGELTKKLKIFSGQIRVHRQLVRSLSMPVSAHMRTVIKRSAPNLMI